MLISQHSLQISNSWKNADKILARLFQERAKARAKNKKQQQPAPNRPPKSGESFWRQESSVELRRRPRPQRRVLYPV